MIGSIRKHSKLLWGTIIPIMIVSLFFFFTPEIRKGGPSGGGLGSINGSPITQQEFVEADHEIQLFFLFHYGEWPDKNPNITQKDIQRETYLRIFLTRKADELGIHASVDAAATAANQMLRALGRNGETVTMNQFVTQVLKPKGLTAADFENFARNDVIIQQLVQTLGLSGALITPQAAGSVYEREHQEIASQIVFFPAEKYFPAVKITPDELGKFYTNYMAEYRLPDRVQINYVAFDITNYLARAKEYWARTNLSEQVDSIYLQYGEQAVPDAKTPEEAKKSIRERLIRSKALSDARADANDFATAVFALTNVIADNLKTVARQKGLTVKTTAPFAANTGPTEFYAPETFTKTAFALTSDEPFANPLSTTNGVYVIALARHLPSEIPPFSQISSRVRQDYQMQQAVGLARAAGTNFLGKITAGMAAGKTFASACTSDGLQPQVLPPFSLSTRDLPALANHAELNQVKQAAFTTAPGHVSNFEPTTDGGFILYVQSRLPVDKTVMNAELPQFTEALRRTRENEAFQEWLQVEAGRALRDTPLAQEQETARPAQ